MELQEHLKEFSKNVSETFVLDHGECHHAESACAM